MAICKRPNAAWTAFKSGLFAASFATSIALGNGAAAAELEHYRVVLFGPTGPLILNVEIDRGAKSGQQVRDEFAQDLFTRLDVDKSGALEETEWAGIPMLGNAPPGDLIAKSRQDGVLKREGLTAVINGQLGPLFEIVAKPKRADQVVRLVDLLDTDGDGVLSIQEVTHGSRRLFQCDLDDDEAISVAELQPFPASIRQAQRQQMAEDPRTAIVFPLKTPEDVAATMTRIATSYSPGEGGLELERCGLRKSATRFDENKDGRLNADEQRVWLEKGEADVSLHVSMDRGRVSVDETRSPRIQPNEGASPRIWNVKLDNTPLKAEVRSNRGARNDSVSFAKTRFLQSDADNNDYLDEAEFGGLQMNVPFSAVDANSDKMLRLDEVETYSRTQADLAQSRVTLVISDDVKSLFQLIDSSNDRFLTTRELMAIERRLPQFDANGNGRFETSDFTSDLVLRFQFAVPANLNTGTPSEAAMMATGGRRLPRSRSGPVWYQKMDRNRDKDISWREFLGPRSTFDRIDANKDGLIDKDEAEAASPVAQAAGS